MALTLNVGKCTLLGNYRENNEDAIEVKKFPELTVCIVADGMGGQAAGEIASRRAIEVIPRELRDLVASVIDAMGGELQDVYVNDLREHTYFAKLRVRQEGELVEVDCRPSDAIALAVTAKVPIYVAEDVLGEVWSE